MLKGDNDKTISVNNLPEQSNTPEERNTNMRNLSFKQQNLKMSEIAAFNNDAQKIIYEDGTVYIGDVTDNMKHGRGKLMDPKGDTYEGDFEEDKIQGKGKFTGADGTIYEGDWHDGQQHGFGKETWADGSNYSGYYKNGVKHGDGKYNWADGSTYSGNWANGNIEGYVGLPGNIHVEERSKVRGRLEEQQETGQGKDV